MTSTQQAVAQRNDHQAQQANNLRNFITRLTPEIQRALPKGLDADRVARIALTLLRTDMLACNAKNKPGSALINCTEESFAGALLTSAALGLEVGLNGEAYLVNYSGECTLIVGYQGMAKLFWQHPMARHLDAQCVYANDDFDYAYGLDPFLKHKPTTGDRGAIIAYYAVAALSSGAKAFVVLSPEEVRALRGGKTGPSGKIADPTHWMERKTVLRQLFKLMPKSSTLQSALDADEKTGTELHRELLISQTPAPAAAPALPPVVETEDAGMVDTSSGEVLDGELEEPNEPEWPETA
jgi:recombination protein RecT